MKTITVFGASNATATELLDAELLGRKIGIKGYILKNGGYGGTMRASAKGCSEAGGKVIGVCVKGNFNGKATPNRYLTEVIFAESISGRVEKLLETDAVITLPGALGTLDELTSAWTKKYMENRYELYVYGERNFLLLEFLKENGLVQKENFSLIKYVKHLDEIDIIR
ncbi:LOG family protein [Candidatus Woesearchaeota archaeon]|nr:LOG family protein [Candidatus Woesearchaeota archaeon]